MHSPSAGGLARPASLPRSLVLQARVVRALLLREVITRYGRRNLGMLWLFVEPMIFTVGIAMLWSYSGLSMRSSLPIVAFAITGYSTVLLWRNTVSHGLHAIRGNLNLLYHRNVKLGDVFAARALLEVAGATASIGVLATVLTATGWVAAPEDPLVVVGAWVLLAWFSMALALVLGSITAFTELVPRIWAPVSYALFPLSGAAFLVEWLPPAGREAVLWLPMVHGVELLREGWFGQVVRTHHDVGYVVSVNLVLSLTGLALLRLAAARMDRSA